MKIIISALKKYVWLPLALAGLLLSAWLILPILLASFQSILATAPYLVAGITVLSLLILKHRNMLCLPWLYIPIGISIKFISWLLLSLYWPDLATPEKLWPFTCNVLYAADVVGSLVILGFGSYIINTEEHRVFIYDLIADGSLLFISGLLAAFILYNDILIDYFSTMTFDNFLVRLQILPFTYYLFISIVMLSVFGKKLSGDQLTYFICIIPFALHAHLEAYVSYVAIPPEQQLLYARASAVFYYAAGISILVYLLKAKKIDSVVAGDEHSFKISPLIWLSSASILIIPPTMIFYQQLITGQSGYHSGSYLLISIASLAIFVRFSMLIFQAQEQQLLLNTEASYDELTGILNRRGFLRHLRSLGASARGQRLLCVLDVDLFKSINDTHGHHIGDLVLTHIGKSLVKNSEVVLAGRLGGDEFVFILKVDETPEQSVRKVHENLTSWQVFDDRRLFVRVSIGATLLSADKPFSTMYTAADNALYQAKSEYRGTAVASPATASEKNRKHDIHELIQKALEQQQILLYFQPIYSLEQQAMCGVEVLLRLRDDEGHIYFPNQFIDIARQQNKILPLTRLLLTELSKIATAENLSGLWFSINLPPDLLENTESRQQILTDLQRLPLDKSRLLLEITEEYGADAHMLTNTVADLRKQGYCFALDDFGAGSASLSRLAYLAVDVVKVDISLLRAAEQGNIAPLESLIALARRLNSKVIIEGIETAAQLAIVRNVGADMGQGFYLSRPISMNRLMTLPRTLRKPGLTMKDSEKVVRGVLKSAEDSLVTHHDVHHC